MRISIDVILLREFIGEPISTAIENVMSSDGLFHCNLRKYCDIGGDANTNYWVTDQFR
jgi:hypothetical protein